MTDDFANEDFNDEEAETTSYPSRSLFSFDDDPAVTDWPVPLRMQAYAPVFRQDEIEAYEKRYRHELKDPAEQAVVKELINHLRKTGVYRRLHFPVPDWRQRLDQLELTFPNFSEYFDVLRAACAIAQCEASSLTIPPVLLCGEPGIGKTFLAGTIAATLLADAPLHTVDFSTTQSSSELSGSSSFWANAKPGILLSSYVYHDYPPVIILDELCKVSVDRFCPYGPLHSMLDDTNKHFRDLAHDWLCVDTSATVYIGIANVKEAIPAPVLSRFKVIDVPNPTPSQSKHITVQLWHSLCNELPGATRGIELAESALDALTCLPPRLIRKTLREAVGRACYHGKNILTEDDVRCLNMDLSAKSRPIGFY